MLDANVDPDIQLNADRRAVKQIALNLLSNAVKFTPDGGAVTVRGRRRGGMVTIAIADNGIGIPKDALRKLGRPFEQVESQLTKRHQGSGLGLAIAKSLVELHGGAMRILLEARQVALATFIWTPSACALKQIALNLLSNAVKFTPDGGAVTVRGRRRAAAWSTIAIADNGIGIPKDALRKLGRPVRAASKAS